MCPEAYVQKRKEDEEETEEKKDRKRRAREKIFEQKKEYHSPEAKIEIPLKTETKAPQEERKPTVEASIKTTVQEKDIVIDDKGTLSKDYSAKDTLKFQRTDTFEQQRKVEEERRAKEGRESRIKMNVKSREEIQREEMRRRVREVERIAEEQKQASEREKLRKDVINIEKTKLQKEHKEKIMISHKDRIEEQRRAVQEHIERQRRDAEKRTREIEQLKDNLNRKKRNINREIETLQKILLGGAFKGKRKLVIGGIAKSLDDFVKSISIKKQK